MRARSKLRGPQRWGLAAAVVAIAWSAASGPGVAQRWVGGRPRQTAADLESLAEALGSESAKDREAAFFALSHLDRDALPAIDARIEALAKARRFDSREASRALAKIRHETGSRRADDMIDIAPGALPRLAHARDPITLRMVEQLALLRSLERIGDKQAGARMADLLAIHYEPWKWESRRIIDRMGVRVLPTLITARGHDERGARRWARAGVERLGLSDPGKATVTAREAGPQVLADLLEAFGEVRDMDAMPVIVSFVAHPRRTVRKAARRAVDAYGRNIIWQLRRAFRIEAGRDAELGWSTARTRRELYRVVDRERLAPARSALNRGLAAFEVDDLDAMEKHFERALAAAPGWSRRLEMAPGFAALGRMQLDEERWDAARRSLGRALALDPAAKAAAEWRALRTFAESEAALAEGRIDLEGYRRVLETVPAHSVAAARIDVWSGARAARARERRRLAGGAGALLFGVAGVSLLWRRRAGRSRLAERRQPDGDEPAAAMPSDSGERGRRPALGAPGAAAPDAHLGAPDTLPG